MRIGAQSGTIDLRHRVTHAIPDETKVNEKLRYQISKAFTADVPKGKEHRCHNAGEKLHRRARVNIRHGLK
jgi:hypothetical protein